LIAIGVETEYKSVTRSLFGHGPKGEPDAPITVERVITDLLRRLMLIRRLDLCMLSIRVEPEYRFVAGSLSRWGTKGESNAPITAENEVANFLRQRRSCSCSSILL
jgi:hypothetical protein